MLGRNAVSNHSTPTSQPMSLDTEAPLDLSVPTHLYTMRTDTTYLTFANSCEQHAGAARQLGHLNNLVVSQTGGGARAFVAVTQTQSPLDHEHKGFGRHGRAGLHHAKPIATRLLKLDIGGELTRLVGLRRYREVKPHAALQALDTQEGLRSTAVRAMDSNGFEGPGGVG